MNDFFIKNEDMVLSPCEDPLSKSTLVSCSSCMCCYSLLLSFSSFLWPHDEALKQFPTTEPSSACRPSIIKQYQTNLKPLKRVRSPQTAPIMGTEYCFCACV